jgi:hypothetical protein
MRRGVLNEKMCKKKIQKSFEEIEGLIIFDKIY